MNKVALAYSFFDSINEIPHSLGNPDAKDAVCNNVDHIIAINGRYEGYNADHDYSNDGSEEYIRKHYPSAIIERFSGYQLDKRQRAFDIAGEMGCDWLIVLDTDEFLEQGADWKAFYENLEKIADKKYEYWRFCLPLFISPQYRKAHNKFRSNRYKLMARIHRMPALQRYVLNHFSFTHRKATDMQVVTGLPPLFNYYPRAIRGISFLTHSKLRDMRFLKNRDGWAWWTQCVERGIEYNLKAHYLYKMHHYSDKTIKSWEYDKKGYPINKDEIVFVKK